MIFISPTLSGFAINVSLSKGNLYCFDSAVLTNFLLNSFGISRINTNRIFFFFFFFLINSFLFLVQEKKQISTNVKHIFSKSLLCGKRNHWSNETMKNA